MAFNQVHYSVQKRHALYNRGVSPTGSCALPSPKRLVRGYCTTPSMSFNGHRHDTGQPASPRYPLMTQSIELCTGIWR